MIRYLAAVLLLAATATIVQFHPPENLALGRGVLRRIPAVFGPWNGRDYSFEDAVVEELKADDLLIRRYERGEDAVWLCLVYHQNRRYGAHDPLLCYESQGYVVESPGHARVDDGSKAGIDANTFVAVRKKERRVVWYWWTTQGLSTSDVWAFRRRMAFMGTLENRSWGAFVRVESVAGDGDLDSARVRVADFASRVAHTLPDVFSTVRRDGAAADSATAAAAPAKAGRP